jgi:hypothetical protein
MLNDFKALGPRPRQKARRSRRVESLNPTTKTGILFFFKGELVESPRFYQLLAFFSLTDPEFRLRICQAPPTPIGKPNGRQGGVGALF